MWLARHWSGRSWRKHWATFPAVFNSAIRQWRKMRLSRMAHAGPCRLSVLRGRYLDDVQIQSGHGDAQSTRWARSRLVHEQHKAAHAVFRHRIYLSDHRAIYGRGLKYSEFFNL